MVKGTQWTHAQPHKHTGDLGSSNSGVTAFAVHTQHTGFGSRVAGVEDTGPRRYVWDRWTFWKWTSTVRSQITVPLRVRSSPD